MRNVAQRHLAPLEASAASARPATPAPRSWRPARRPRASPALARLCERLLEMGLERGDLVVALGGGVIGDLAGLRRQHRAPRHPLRADPDHAAGAGRLLRRRQDRHQHAAGQEPGRRLPSAEPRAGRHRRAGHAAARASSAPATPRWPSTACSATRPSSPGWSRTGRPCSRRDAAALTHAIADQRAGQGRHRRPRRDGDRRAHAAQPRPHVRPCARGLGRLFRPAAARRGHRHRHLPGVPLVARSWALSATTASPRVEAHLRRRRPADPHRRHSGRAVARCGDAHARSWVRTRRCAPAG